MKLRFKEDPKEWRKQVAFTALGLAILSSVLCWRRVIPVRAWWAIVIALDAMVLCALVKAQWFRGFYRFSMRLGFYSSQFVGRVVLFAVFVLVVTPLGFFLRLSGKDSLQLRQPREAKTYWHEAKECSPSDRLF